ncbi:hypothetical protein DJ71_10670, partial [Halorubrum sp. E3]
MSKPTTNYVDGEWRGSETGETIEVRNPANPDEVVATYPRSDKRDAAAAVDAAATAEAAWRDTPGPERGRILREAGTILDGRKEELTDILVAEEGKARPEAAGEVQRTIDIFHYFAGKASDLAGTRKASSGRDTNLYTRREPVGVAALVTPWNYPIAIPAWKLAPALVSGNTVVLKPASLAPGVVIEVARALDEAGLPDGVLNVVTGFTGRAIEAVDDPELTGQLERVVDTAERLLRLGETSRKVERLLSQRPSPRPVALAPAVDAALESLPPEIRERAAVDVDVPEGIAVSAVAYLPEAITELVDNAVRHNDADDPRVRISAAELPSESWVSLVVADDGPG